MKRLSLAMAFALLTTLPAHAEMLPGYDRFDVQSAHRSRLISASVWYPAASPTYRAPVGDNPIFNPTMAFIGPAIAPDRHPLVLFSHGSGGRADTSGWLLGALAARGAIVLAVDHPGSSSGDSSARRSADLTARAKDLSAALDQILSDAAYGPFIDEANISMVGFSLGGATVLSLAGLRFDGAAQDRLCAADPEAGDCRFFKQGGVRFAAVPGFATDGRDDRIRRAVVVDPAFGGAVSDDSIGGLAAKVSFINLGTGGDLIHAADVSPAGNGLAARLPGATVTSVAPATHFTFLATCKEGAQAMLEEEGEDPICTDPAGAVRSEVHDQLIDTIATALGH